MTRDSFAAHAAALDAARANRDLARDQFQHGLVNELVVLTAEQQYQSAALTAIQADVQRFSGLSRTVPGAGRRLVERSGPRRHYPAHPADSARTAP